MPLPKPNIVDEVGLRMLNLAKLRSERENAPLTDSLRAIAGEMRATEELMSQIHERNALLNLKAKRDLMDFVERFPTYGEGLLARIQGVAGTVEGSRNSVDYNAKALHGKYFGRLVSELEQNDLFHVFNTNELVDKIYKEMGALEPGKVSKSVTGDERAFKIARIVDSITEEATARMNRGGAYINRMPGYILRQTHDMDAIRSLGDLPTGHDRETSFSRWTEFTLPRLDHAKTFQGADALPVMRQIHEELYTGVYGRQHDEAEISPIGVTPSLADKVSGQRKLHFKDANAAYEYNQAFGIRDFKEAIMMDLHHRARATALMEALGPNWQATMQTTVRELQERARTRPDAIKQLESLKDWRIQAALNEVTGKNEVPQNVSLNRMIGTGKVILQMAKMGGVVLSSFTDKAFLQSELAFQGMNHLQILGKQLTTFAKRTKDEKQTLRLMGVAMDGLIGNAMARYSNHSTVSGWAHAAQKRFFDLNFLNMWTDAHKASAAELMAAHLGEHANVPWTQLPQDLSKVLSLYDISRLEWDALRNTAYDHNGQVFITPDKVKEISDAKIKTLLRGEQEATPENLLRARDQLETKIRTYISDRVDYAVPTPGAAERKYATFNTQAGTPLGEAVRLIMLFKSFPITIMNKIVGRSIYGNGASSIGQWLLHDHKGKFNLAMLMAMGTAAGYLSGAVRDALKGRTPKPLMLEDGSMNYAAINDAAIRGGSLGILGDILFAEYDRGYKSMLSQVAGPVFSQLDTVGQMTTLAKQGKFDKMLDPAGKLAMDNTPLINLFYIRPILDYLILWNLEEMMSPGTLHRMESAVERKNHQNFFVRPSEVINN